jgi:spermidine synthase
MIRILSALFFLSGAAALLFETLWFRQAGLAFGNSVWASSLVLAGFMAGLALGNAAMAGFGDRIRRPVRFYAGLETVIGASGLALVYSLPVLGEWLAPLFRLVLDQPWLLNPLRLGLGFLLLLLASTAMGATLPVLVKAFSPVDPSFGSVLGRLYGWNTLGAVVGALLGEATLIESFGIRGAAWIAAAMNAVAAVVALGISQHLGSAREAELAPDSTRVARTPLDRHAARILAATFLAGGILLALEVVWFRFMRLFVLSTSLVFAIMLAVVLCGIALGGLLAARRLRRSAASARQASVLALAAGTLVIALYAGFSLPLSLQENFQLSRPEVILGLSFCLMFPVSLLSGMLFALLAERLHEHVPEAVRAAGWLTLANTVGAALGSALAGFLLLPIVGMEGSFLALGAAYAGVALLAHAPAHEDPVATPGRLGPLAVFALALALVLFPFGKMETDYLRVSIGRWDPDHQEEVVAVREGRTETIVYLRKALDGETIHHRLLTDGFAMSGTWASSRRYQKLYVYWPVALHPDPRRALVISYGVGSTAKALVDTKSLSHIDVVDISREILEMSEIPHPVPGDDPLNDPRVRVHVEDGRFFLQTTGEKYDIITGEPPPPKNAGVVSLYTEEYFRLIHDRLADGGITTYWLPVHNTRERDTKAIIRAFCNVFEECSLWSGLDLDWMLVGSRNAKWTKSESLFVAQWRDPQVLPELRAVGVEVPEQLGALFMADARQLERWIDDVPPLTDDFPKRLDDRSQTVEEAREQYGAWMDTDRHRERFLASTFIDRAWPESLRGRTLPYFDVQRLIEASFSGEPARYTQRLQEVDHLLRGTPLVTLPLWRLQVSGDGLRAADALLERGSPEGRFLNALTAAAIAERQIDLALERARSVQGKRAPNAVYLEAWLLTAAGMPEEARSLHETNRSWLPDQPSTRRFWAWLADLPPLPR